MSHRATPGSRTRAFVLLLLQVVLAGVAPIADARLEAEATHGGAHVESESTDCRLGHDHLFCTICRAIDGGAEPVQATPDLPARAGVLYLPTASPDDRRAVAQARTSGHPRAPPTA